MKNVNAGNVITEVSSYISGSGKRELPAEVMMKAKHHILDTLAAMVSGSTLKPGMIVKTFMESQNGVAEAQVSCSHIIASAANAAFANGMMAHADETDDSNPRSLMHPGCAIVPTALAVSEREEADGISFLRGVVVGYDIGCRITQALGVENLQRSSHCSHSIGGCFGAAAAAAALLGLDDIEVSYALSYAAQQASGVSYYVRDGEHIEKAFVFGGMPARNGVTAAMLVKTGFTGVSDPFSGEHNFFQAFSPQPRPQLLAEGLGSRYEIMLTNLKKYSVGSPVQAPIDAILLLMEKHGLTSKNVQNIVVRLPPQRAQVVNDREMPDINLQYLLAVSLLDGDLNFEEAHSFERMKDSAVLSVKRRINLVKDKSLSRPETVVEVLTTEGAKFEERTVGWRGAADNPLTTEEVERKCRKLLAPTLGKERSQRLIDLVWNLEQVRNIRELRPLLTID